jgi:hypothetical protein
MSNLKTWPENLWLSIFDEHEGRELPDFKDAFDEDGDGVSAVYFQSIGGVEIKYVRADLVEQVRAEERKRCVKVIARLIKNARSIYKVAVMGRCIEAIEALEDDPPVWTDEMLEQVEKDAEMIMSKMKPLPEAE